MIQNNERCEDTRIAGSRTGRVLVVEDDDGLRNLIQRALGKAGYEVDGVPTGAAAIGRIKADLGLALLLDQKLSDMTGSELINALNEQKIRVPFVVMTSQGSERLAVEMMKLGAVDYLVKTLYLVDLLPGVFQRLFRELDTKRQLCAAETALRESERQLRELFDDAPIGYHELDGAGRIIRVNRTELALLGYSAREMLGRHVWEFVEEREVSRRSVLDKLAGTLPPGPETERTYRKKDGTGTPVLIQDLILRDKEGKVSRIRTTVQSISERKRAEEDLQRFFKFVPDLVCIASIDGRFRRINPIWSATLGYTEQEILATSFFDLIHPDDRDATMKEVARQLAGEPTVQFANRYRCKDLSHRWLEWRMAPAVDRSLFFASARDITDRKRTEERLRKQVTLLDSANDAIYVRLLDHTVTYWNKGAARLYGWSAAETVGRKLTELGLVEPVGFATAHAALLAQGDWSGEVNKTGKDGKERVVFCRWTLLRDEQGHPREVLAINTDITEKKQWQSQYLRAQRMEGIGMLAGGIAHDLNNILTPIMMSVSLLHDAVHDAENRQLLDSVQSSVRRGAEIIRQLLTFARGQPGVRAPVPVRQLLREMGKLIRETYPRNLRLAVTVPSELWPVVGDATQIHQALMNLCVNARDAMPDGGTLTLAADNVTLDAASSALMPDTKPGPHVLLCVSDTGAGIPAAELGHIFDPFFTTKEIGKGTGLGLPTVLGIVRGHGGSVRVDSRMGQGTTFELYLPATPEAKAADTSEREVRLPRGHGELILVVEDEASVCGPTQRVLEKYGYRVLAAAEGEAALVLFARHRTEIKAVLTDMMMPGMDGPKLVRALRQLDARLPILGMTGLLERGTFKGLEELDAVPLLAKPFEVEKLLVALHQTLTTGNPTTGPST
jgi:PAS domain S-box-containing protein